MRFFITALLCIGMSMTIAAQPLSRVELQRAMASLPSRSEVPAAQLRSAMSSPSPEIQLLQQHRAVSQGNTRSSYTPINLNLSRPVDMVAAMDQYALIGSDYDDVYLDGTYMGFHSLKVTKQDDVRNKIIVSNLAVLDLPIVLDPTSDLATIPVGTVKTDIVTRARTSLWTKYTVYQLVVVPEAVLNDVDADWEDICGTQLGDGSIAFDGGFALLTRKVDRTLFFDDFNGGDGELRSSSLNATTPIGDTTYTWSPLITNFYLLTPNGTHECEPQLLSTTILHPGDTIPTEPADTTDNPSGFVFPSFDPSVLDDIILIDDGTTCQPDNYSGHQPIKRPPTWGLNPINPISPIVPGDFNPQGLGDALNGLTDPNNFKLRSRPGSVEEYVTKEPVYMWQDQDTLYVLNLYADCFINANGTLTKMVIDDDGVVSFPSQDVIYYSDGTTGCNFHLEEDSSSGYASMTPGNTGCLDEDCIITWDDTALPQDEMSNPQTYFINNKLYINVQEVENAGAKTSITDVTSAINRVINGDPDVNITTVTRMINQMLNQE